MLGDMNGSNSYFALNNPAQPSADVTSYYDALTNAAARNSNQSLISAGLIYDGGGGRASTQGG